MASSPVAAQPVAGPPIRLVVPFAPGGGVDAIARILATEMSKDLGQTVIVDNRAGAAGTVGTAFVAKQAPDGQTLCFCVTGVMTITPLADPAVPYKPLTDLVPVSHISNMGNVLMVRKDIPAENLQELIAFSKSKSGGLTYGTPGAGGTHHLGGEWLKDETGLNMRHVPYKGESAAINDLLAGQIDLVIGTVASATPLVNTGKIKAIVNTGATRSKLLPDVKTVMESGFRKYAWVNFVGINAPAGTPAAIVEKLSRSAQRAVQSAPVSERIVALGFEPIGSTAQDYARLLEAETKQWAQLLKTTNFTR